MEIFEERGSWYKGVLHTHSQRSDGSLTVEELTTFYRTREYDFLAVTDHDIVSDGNSSAEEGFLSIPSVELRSKTPSGKDLHLVGLNVSSDFKVPENRDAQELIDRVREVGGEVVAAHPYWSEITSQDLLSFSDYIGIEVFNTLTHRGFGRGLSSTHWDEILSAGRRVYGFAVDDAHFLPEYFGGFKDDALGGWIMVKAPSLEVKDLMEAIRKGNFYASSGPEFHGFKYSNGVLEVHCSGVQSISFICSPGHLSRRIEEESRDLTYAEFKPSGNLEYVRVECEDRKGNRAWLNPVFPDE